MQVCVLNEAEAVDTGVGCRQQGLVCLVLRRIQGGEHLDVGAGGLSTRTAVRRGSSRQRYNTEIRMEFLKLFSPFFFLRSCCMDAHATGDTTKTVIPQTRTHTVLCSPSFLL